MSRIRFALGTALALVGLLAATPRAEADYTYTASLVINSVTGSGGVITNTPATGATFASTNGTTVTLSNIISPGAFVVGDPLSANVGNVAVTTTSRVADSFAVNYTINGTLTEPLGGPNLTASTTGTMTFSNILFNGTSFSGTVVNQYTGPFMVGPGFLPGAVFFISVPTAQNGMFGPPTIGVPVGGQGNGNLGALITSSVIPEPSSAVMLGLGLVGVAGIGLRRRA
jgi:hypothetical protein